MTSVVLAGRVGHDLMRIHQHLLMHEVGDVQARIDEIIDALQVLTQHPLIGRKVGGGRRELVIGRGARGYVALYAYDQFEDVVAVTGLRAQREAGFSEG